MNFQYQKSKVSLRVFLQVVVDPVVAASAVVVQVVDLEVVAAVGKRIKPDYTW